MAYELKSVANEIVIESQLKITIKVGPNSIVLEPQGVTINCINLKMESQAMTEVTAQVFKETITAMTSNITMYVIEG